MNKDKILFIHNWLDKLDKEEIIKPDLHITSSLIETIRWNGSWYSRIKGEIEWSAYRSLENDRRNRTWDIKQEEIVNDAGIFYNTNIPYNKDGGYFDKPQTFNNKLIISDKKSQISDSKPEISNDSPDYLGIFSQYNVTIQTDSLEQLHNDIMYYSTILLISIFLITVFFLINKWIKKKLNLYGNIIP